MWQLKIPVWYTLGNTEKPMFEHHFFERYNFVTNGYLPESEDAFDAINLG